MRWARSMPPGGEAPLDLLIVGAGISGIGMAAKLAMHCPDMSYAVLDRREQAGGTWDLFRYPGIRSDSDMHTFAYHFAPWREDETIASAAQIRDYLARVVDENGIAAHMRFGRHVEAADWDSAAGVWRVQARRADGTVEQLALPVPLPRDRLLRLRRSPRRADSRARGVRGRMHSPAVLARRASTGRASGWSSSARARPR